MSSASDRFLDHGDHEPLVERPAELEPYAEFDLYRVAIRVEGCFGVLLHLGIPFATTLEHTYTLAGHMQLVKIPPGVWTCRSQYFHGGGYDTYEVTGVPGHSKLLFHRGNVEDDSDGCILVGTGFGTVFSKPAVTQSRLAFESFMLRTRGVEQFKLRVRQA